MLFQKYQLQNGSRVILAPLHETQAVTVLVLFPVGSRYEKKVVNGVSHFLEHMMFKGTKKRPDTQTISRELDRVGAEFNAYTSKDHTGYYVKITHDRLEHALDITSDMLYNSLFKQEEITREKNVVIEEIHMYEDNPMMHIDDIFEELLFGATPLGWQISGSRETVAGLPREAIVKHFKTFYRPKDMVLAIGGRFDEVLARKLIEKYYVVSGHKFGIPTKALRVTAGSRGPRVRLQFKETQQVHLQLGVRAYPYRDPRLPALNLLNVILGGNMSSRLFINIRERHGLCYYIRSGVGSFHDTGVFGVQAGLDKGRIRDAIKLIVAELTRMREKGVTEKELYDAKQFVHGKMTLGLEESSEIAEWCGKQEVLTNQIKTPEEKLIEIDKVTQADVHGIA
ncbi:insulinase family protein, partial [Candidatus Uhrbacteria bacterium]|nr:insulinase family protein [Candidatus Uhrbacteria bacterium]